MGERSSSPEGLRRVDSKARTGSVPASLRTGLRPPGGTGFQTAETERKSGTFVCGDPTQRPAKVRKTPIFYRATVTGTNGVRALKTGWWAHQGSNLGPAD